LTLSTSSRYLPMLPPPPKSTLFPYTTLFRSRNWLKRTFTNPIHTEAVMDVAINVNDVYMAMPFTVGDYVDFYASENHASNLGRILRPNEEPLKPNWKHMPVSYHGRASTVFISGTSVYRPKGIRRSEEHTSELQSRFDLVCRLL